MTDGDILYRKLLDNATNSILKARNSLRRGMFSQKLSQRQRDNLILFHLRLSDALERAHYSISETQDSQAPK